MYSYTKIIIHVCISESIKKQELFLHNCIPTWKLLYMYVQVNQWEARVISSQFIELTKKKTLTRVQDLYYDQQTRTLKKTRFLKMTYFNIG